MSNESKRQADELLKKFTVADVLCNSASIRDAIAEALDVAWKRGLDDAKLDHAMELIHRAAWSPYQ